MSTSSIACLVVESDSDRAEQIIEFLKTSERFDFLCHLASNLFEANRKLVDVRADIVISKGVFPDIEHLDVVTRYRKNEYDSVVLCLLEDEEKSVILDSAQEAADDYIFYKDLTAERLLEAVEHGFERRVLLNELKTVQAGPGEGKAVYRGLLHCLDAALFLVSRPDGELLFNNKVADAWFPESKESTLKELFEYGVLESELIELEILTENAVVPNAELRSVIVEWKGRECSLVTLRNISKRKRAEEAYKASQRRLDLALKASNIGLWSWDLRKNQLHFSERWKGQLGYSGSEFSNSLSAFRSKLHADDHLEVEEVFGQALRGEISEIELKYRMRHKEGGFRWILCRAEIFPDDSGKLSTLLGSHIDITDRNPTSGKLGLEASLSEKLSIRMERIAAELEKNASEIRSNFRGDSAIVERIQELERLSRSFSCLNEVLQLDASRSDHVIEAIDLVEETNELYNSQRSLLPAKASLQVEATGEIRLHGLSRRGLRFALTEALICVADKVSADMKNRIQVSIGRRKRSEDLDSLPFARFVYQGEKIGKAEMLALSKTLHISVTCEGESSLSALEIVFESDERSPTATQASSQLALLAEDEGVLRLAIRTMLESLGFEVVVAKDGAEAVNAFARRKSEFALALVDLQMPEIDGYGVVASIRATREDLPVIRMSGDSADERSELLDRLDEHSCFLSKPFGISELKKAIEDLSLRVRA
ncbi:PAS fold family [Verrucomicrobiia bacterium DG1235]|nr:PAS fold family [Verrucomicrobiae bacterium DG1235]